MPRKIHYCDGRLDYVPVCGTPLVPRDHRVTTHARVTCRLCWLRILEDVAPWAPGFLGELSGKVKNRQLATYAEALGSQSGFGQPDTITVPGATTTPVNGKVKGLGNGFARAFRKKSGPQVAVSEFLTLQASLSGPVEPVVYYSGTTGDPVRVKKGQVAEQPGDAGQVSNEASGDFQPPV